MSLSNEFVIEIICYQYYRVLHNIGVWKYKNMLRFPRTSSTAGQRIIHIFVHVNITITITVTNRGERLSPHHRMIFASKSHLDLLHTRYSDHIRNFPWFLSIHCIIPRRIHTLTLGLEFISISCRGFLKLWV